ncbi:uncharacterized protein LODBEIA_P06320 [Lodderomyces beijingensis]|uniref:Uncharacterized protein n=1 Tax=Lodderomyces beijingensis TaxID=1775926 RepID=A0ABP0ZFQ7_9ASCO
MALNNLPLDEEEQFSTADYDFTKLRAEVIGNKDLKFKLANDGRFSATLVSRLGGTVDNFIGTRPVDATLVQPLEEQLVLSRVFTCFIAEIDCFNYENVTRAIMEMGGVLEPLISLLNHYADCIVPQFPTSADKNSDSSSSSSFIRNFEFLIEQTLEIILALANLRNYSVDFGRLSRYITLLLVEADANHTRIPSNILAKSLRLVPLTLRHKTTGPEAEFALLVALFDRLTSDSILLVGSHMRDSMRGTNEEFQELFFGADLPHVDLKASVVDSYIDFNVLLQTITSAAQTLTFLKTKDYQLMLKIEYRDSNNNNNNNNNLLNSRNNGSNSRANTIPFDPRVYLALLLLLKIDSPKVTLPVLNLIVSCFEILEKQKVILEDQVYLNYERIFPRITSLLYSISGSLSEANNHKKDDKKNTATRESEAVRQYASLATPPYLRSAALILADLSVQHPKMLDHVADTNIDCKLIDRLVYLFKTSQEIKELRALKMESSHGSILVDFTLLKTYPGDGELSDLLLLLSVFASEREDYRHRIVAYYQAHAVTLPELIFEILDDYHFLCNQLRLTYKLLQAKRKISAPNSAALPRSHLIWLGRNLGAITALISSSLYTNCLYLIRSLSRSVSTLRTFFVESNAFRSFITKSSGETNVDREGNHFRLLQSLTASSLGTHRGTETTATNSVGGFVTNLLEVVRHYETLDQEIDFFIHLNGNDSVDSRGLNRTLMVNKALCIGLLANFILDFSSFRYKIVGYESFLTSLATIYHNSSSDAEFEPAPLNEEDEYERDLVQLKILQVWKNFMFNEAGENKSEATQYFPVSFIIRKASYGLTAKDVTADLSPENKQIKIQQKIVAFEILRNYTAGSPQLAETLRVAYREEFVDPEMDVEKFPATWADFLVSNVVETSIFLGAAQLSGKSFSDNDVVSDDIILTTLLLNENYVKLVKSINIIESHSYTVTDKVKQNTFPTDALLRIWLRFLSFEIPESALLSMDTSDRLSAVNSLNSIRLSVAWVIVNLTWKSSVFHYDVDEDFYEVYKTHDALLTKKRNGGSLYEKKDRGGVEEETNKQQSMSQTFKSASGEEMTVYDRAKYLDKFGFTEAIYAALTNYIKKRSNRRSHGGFDISEVDVSLEHEAFQNLRTAAYQINYLCTGNSAGAADFSLNDDVDSHPSMKLERKPDNSIEVVSAVQDRDRDQDRETSSEAEATFERSRRREAISSEVNSDDGEEQEAHDDDDDDDDGGGGEQGEEQGEDDDDDDMSVGDEFENARTISEAAGNDGGDSDDDPHEPWIM